MYFSFPVALMLACFVRQIAGSPGPSPKRRSQKARRSGIFSIAMYDDKNGVIVGGNYEKPNEAKDNLAFTTDGGKDMEARNGLYRLSLCCRIHRRERRSSQSAQTVRIFQKMAVRRGKGSVMKI